MKLINQCRVFLKNPNGQLKKIYSIRAYPDFFQVQIWSKIICKDLGLPLKSEIHYQYYFNEADLHLSIKYHDMGPFNDPKIIKVENYISFSSIEDQYKHKQIILTRKHKPLKKTYSFPFTKEIKTKYLIGYQPPAFSDYKNSDQVYYFPTISTPITTPTNEALSKNPWLNGDSTKSSPTKNDIVVDESIDPNVRINVCGFVSSEGFHPLKEAVQWQSRTIATPSQLQFGINVIFS
ncbi:MAG: hypothetical protein K1060chlam5_00627 [Candidatus Anoxychlamydiales bacterium]|nr:hypothetical protein [Candidatus Anoxychlamydiales bacterium]